MTVSSYSKDAFTPSKLYGARVRLVPFSRGHITDRYLRWLEDDEVNRYSRRFGQPAPTPAQAGAWLEGLAADEVVYAIETQDLGHIGNIKYGPVNWSNLAADLSILVGETRTWGRGFGAEATYLVSRHLFEDRGVNRISAASINPAFIRMVEKLGWVREGVQREESRVAGKFHNSILLSLIRRDFKINPGFEPEADHER